MLSSVTNCLNAAFDQVAVQTMNLSGFESLFGRTISESRVLIKSAHLISNCQLLKNLCLLCQKFFFKFLVPSFFFLQALLSVFYHL